MPDKQSPLQQLQAYLPENCFDDVVLYLNKYKVHLTIKRERKSVLGDYRNSVHNKAHRISVNGNLNKYSFLITLLHELGHLLAFERFGNRIQPHGLQWKKEYGSLLERFITKKIFPENVEAELMRSLKSPAASSCAEEGLLRVLKKYDAQTPGIYFIEDLPPQSVFKVKGGRMFCKGNVVRKRFLCKEVPSGKMFLFSPVAEVELVQKEL